MNELGVQVKVLMPWVSIHVAGTHKPWAIIYRIGSVGRSEKFHKEEIFA
jgi:hypothetical protein